MKALVGVTSVMNVLRYIVMNPATPMNRIALSRAGANSLRSGVRPRFIHSERMPVELTSRPPKNSIRCGGL